MTPALLKLLRKAQRQLDRLAGRLSDVSDDVATVAKVLEDLAGHVPGETVRRRARHSAEEVEMMGVEAEAGVPSLAIRWRADGAGDVSVNGRRSFRLPPKLAALLAIIVARDGEDDGGLVRWRTQAEVATALNKRTGGTLAQRAVPGLVYKLREAFRDAGENVSLIDSNRRGEVRARVWSDRR